MKSHLYSGTAILLALIFCSTAFALPQKTGDDDDIDDLIVERAEGSSAGSTGRANQNRDGLEGSTTRPAASDAVSPASGNWGEFVTVTGPGYGGADGVQVRVYPNDDDSQPATMRQTATLYGRQGADAIQIQIPQDPARSGWSGDFANGVVRVYVYMPGQLEPVLAGRYTVGTPVNRAALRAGLGRDLTLATQPSQPDGDSATTTPDSSSSDRPAVGPSGLIPGSTLNAEITPAPGSATPPIATSATEPAAASGFDRFANTPGSELRDSPLEIRDAGQPAPSVNDISPNSPTELRLQIFQQPAPADKAADPAFRHIAWEIHVSRVGTNTSNVLHRRVIAGPDDRLDGTWPLEVVAGHVLPAFEYDVWVTSEYADGTRKPGHVIRVRMPDAVNPQGFTAAPYGPSSARLSWSAVPGVTHYVLNGSGLASVKVTDTLMTVPNLGPGNHEWTLIAVYGAEGVYNDLDPSTASLTIGAGSAGAAAATQGRYRISVVGFTAHRATYDNPLQLDGKGDEVFLSTSVKIVDAAGQTATGGLDASLRSAVYGDTNFKEGEGRRKAGNLSSQGGIGNGNSFPAQPWSGVPDTSDPVAIPMVLWSGTLTQGGNAVIVTPTLWEYDGSGFAGAFQSWVAWSGRTLDTLSGVKLVEMSGYESPVQLDFGSMGAGLALDFQESIIGSDGDRPIGMQIQGGRGVFAPKSIVLTYSAAESLLVNNIGSLPPGVYPLQYQDDPKWWGEYTLYLKIERLP